ncbi:MAG: hypothetical protein LAT79_14455 [Kiritimatiellae bacterium]|nr:hypothetical protein [Kiritimatiellia bacterium]
MTGQGHGEALKWLRFYWDFCAKYRHPPQEEDSLMPFLQKLASKGQSPEQQAAATEAVRLCQEILRHSDVRTTMIYTHTVPSRTQKERKSPLDFPK